MELNFIESLGAVPEGKIVEDVQRVDVESKVRRELFNFDFYSDLVGSAVADGLNQTLKSHNEVVYVRSVLFVLEEMGELLNDLRGGDKEDVPDPLYLLL